MYLGGTVRSSMLATWRKSREFSVDSHDTRGNSLLMASYGLVFQLGRRRRFNDER